MNTNTNACANPPDPGRVSPTASTRDDSSTDDDDQREATELRDINTYRARRRALTSASSTSSQRQHPIRRWWKHNVRISVPHEKCRDHLANERTFLAYLRTSAAFSVIGILIAQLYRLQHAPHPDATFGYFQLSKPLSAIFQTAAVVLVILGFIRFFRQQNAMARGTVHSGGWEMFVISGGAFLLLVTVFVLHVAVDIYKSMK